MDRREFLHRGGPFAGLACLAGCLGSAASDSPGGSATGRTSREDATTTDGAETTTDQNGDGSEKFSGVDSAKAEPFRSLSVGSREDVAFPDNNRPHSARVWNDADEDRELVVRACRDARELLDRTISFDADAYLEVELNEPGDYRVAVGLADEQPTTFRARPALFDCNASSTDVGVAPDGRVETTTFSTLMGCPAPEVSDASLSVGEAECGTAHSASVTYDGEQVRVDGAVRTPEPGYDLELADASYDAESGELEIRVRATEGDLWGVQCIGEVPYEATVEFENDLPDEVVVVHEGGEDDTEVTRAGR